MTAARAGTSTTTAPAGSPSADGCFGTPAHRHSRSLTDAVFEADTPFLAHRLTGLGVEQAALPTVGLSARALMATGGVQPGETGLVVGATGGVGTARNPDPPDHQILRPESSAQVHTVVVDDARDRGVGAALLDAAEKWAVARGIAYLSAGIHHRNAGAVRFYGRYGFTDSGISLVRRLNA